jgi:threonine synthase
MRPVDSLVCRRCGARHPPDSVEYTCPEHDGVAGVLDVTYDEAAMRSAFAPSDGPVDSLWDYEALLPIDTSEPVVLGAGGTDLLAAPRLGEALGVDAYVKDEGANPTGSNKDRGSAVVATRARNRGHDVVTCASTGNAAASLAGYAARAGLACRIFVPADVPEAKAVQPQVYGADVLAVEGSYEDAYDLCRTVSRERGWYNRSAAINPYAVEGNRTLGFEIAEQTDATPDWVVLPMGNGCTLAGAWKGLRQFADLGLADGTPRMLGVQAAGATAIHDQFHRERANEEGAPAADGAGRPATEPADRDEGGGPADRDRGVTGTAADSIDVTGPHNAGKACEALHESGGDAVVVDDDAILDAQRLLGETEGLFAEPASAAAVAGLRRARERGIVADGDTVVVVATGTGLKDTATASEAVGDTVAVGSDPGTVPDSL